MLRDIQKYCNKFGLIEGGYFYSTEQIMKKVALTREKSLERFLERLFTKDLLVEDVN